MSVQIKEVSSRKELRAFVNFPEKLYRNNPYYVPPLVFDQMDTLDQKKGAAQEFCDSKLFLAYKDGELVGRVAAIVNRLANEQWNHKEVRFGWYDFIDDKEVSSALMDKVIEFGKSHGMDKIVGPLGFTDFDPEGLLVEGFDRMSTMPLIYNHPYYVEHIEGMGFEKDVDWLEYHITVPPGELPERWTRLANLVLHHTNCTLRHLTMKMVRKEKYAYKLFDCINECYKSLYNFTILPKHMAEKYIGFYLTLLDLSYVTLIENEKKELVAFGISMPSIAKDLQKCRGKLFPFGWARLLYRLRINQGDGVELLLMGVRPDYQNSGLNSLLFLDSFTLYKNKGIKWAESNAILEDNFKMASQLRDYEYECKKRRRSYIRKI